MIISPGNPVEDIYWQKRRTGVVLKAESVVVVPDSGSGHDMMVVKLANGSYISSRDISGAAYLPGNWPWTDAIIRALVKLGAITKANGDDHLALCQARIKEQQDGYRAHSLEATLKDCGLPATKAQQAFIDANKGKAW